MARRRAAIRILCTLCAAAAALVAAAQCAAAEPHLCGGDISMLPRFEALGAVYRDNGKPGDAIRIMMSHGCNCFRVRLFVNPTMEDGVIQDLPYAVSLARRIKEAGNALLLDIHYSDTWADPGHQSKPAAWNDLDFAELAGRVHAYSAGVVRAMKDAGCLPDIVQIGNEITPGFLWPEGEIGAAQGGWSRFAALLDAAVRGVKQPLQAGDSLRIMIHIDTGGSAAKTAWFFRNLERHGVDYDLIGLSYYPWWQGGIADLEDNLRKTAEEFGKGIVVVETAYPWRPDTENTAMAWPQTPAGQRRFLEDVMRAVDSTPDGLGRGVLWWYPEAIPVQGLDVWKGGAAALFDARGDALPAMDAFRAWDK
jgi:arabinogalactan endo-1,4-beta-galactosidase